MTELEKTTLINRIEAVLDSSRQGDSLESDSLLRLKAMAEGAEDPETIDQIGTVLDGLEKLTDIREKIREERERTERSIEELERVADMLDAKKRLMDRIERDRRKKADEIKRRLGGGK